MKNEIYICDICGSRFDSVDFVGNSCVFNNNNGTVVFDQVCDSCIGTIESALKRCGLKNDKITNNNTKTF